MSTHIVVLDGYTIDQRDRPWRELERFGTADVYDRTAREEVIERAQGANIVLTNKVPVTAEALEALETLEFISVLATGYDVIAIEHAAQLGIPVSNVPEYGTDSVAEHVFALLLELTRRVGDHDASVRRGDWADCPDFTFWNTPLVELRDKTLGIIGFGRIGARVAEIGRAFGMEILADEASSRPLPEGPEFMWSTTDEIIDTSEIVSLNCPLNDDTHGLIGTDELERMDASAYLINTARGELVDSEALAAALEAGEIAGAGLDVVAEEPIGPGHPLLDCETCIVTPHNAWPTLEARERLKQTTLDNIEAYLAGAPIHVVNDFDEYAPLTP